MKRITNSKFKIQNLDKRQRYLRKFYILIFTFLILAVGNAAMAHTSGFWTPGEPIVPCGYGTIEPSVGLRVCPFGTDPQYCVECDQCQLFHLAKHLIDFILIAAAPILATVFFIVAGVYMMLGGTNPGMLSQGKSIFKNTFIGLLIVMLAWLITNTLIQSLVDPSFYGTGPGTQWYEFYCPGS